MRGSVRQIFIFAFSILVLFVSFTKGSGQHPSKEYTKPSQRQDPTTVQPIKRRMTKMTLVEARMKAPFTVREPSYLPAGVRYVETRYIEFNDHVFVVIQYEFEGKDIYFQIDEYSPTVTEMELPGTQHVRLGKYDGEAVFQHGLTVIRWTQDGTRLLLNGAIDREEAIKVAASVR